jgi:glutaconate CoA-transferase subunit A
MPSKHTERAKVAKVMTMAEAVRQFVADGDLVYVAGFSHAIAFSAGHEIIRQRKRGLTLCRATPDMIYDQMVAAGCATKLIFSWVGNPGLGNLHCIGRALAEGMPFEEYSHYQMLARLVAGGTGLPFYPLPEGSGGELAQHNANLKTITDPYTGSSWVAVPPLRPDVVFIHVQRSDRDGNSQMWGVVGDVRDAAASARRVIASVEAIVPEDVVRRDPNRTILPGFLVDAVVLEPWGAHPSPVQGHYDRDNDAYRSWSTISREPNRVTEFLEEWVYGVDGRADYVRRQSSRLKRLEVGTSLSEPVNYGTA